MAKSPMARTLYQVCRYVKCKVALDRLHVAFLPPSNGARQFFGTWRSPAYSMPVTGTLAGGKLSVFGANTTKRYFNGNVNCAVAGTIGGSWVAGCGASFGVNSNDQPPEFPNVLVEIGCSVPLKARKARGWRIGGVGELP